MTWSRPWTESWKWNRSVWLKKAVAGRGISAARARNLLQSGSTPKTLSILVTKGSRRLGGSGRRFPDRFGVGRDAEGRGNGSEALGEVCGKRALAIGCDRVRGRRRQGPF